MEEAKVPKGMRFVLVFIGGLVLYSIFPALAEVLEFYLESPPQEAVLNILGPDFSVLWKVPLIAISFYYIFYGIGAHDPSEEHIEFIKEYGELTWNKLFGLGVEVLKEEVFFRAIPWALFLFTLLKLESQTWIAWLNFLLPFIFGSMNRIQRIRREGERGTTGALILGIFFVGEDLLFWYTLLNGGIVSSLIVHLICVTFYTKVNEMIDKKILRDYEKQRNMFQ